MGYGNGTVVDSHNVLTEFLEGITVAERRAKERQKMRADRCMMEEGKKEGEMMRNHSLCGFLYSQTV